MMGRKAREFACHPAVCLEQLVPPDDFYRYLDAKLDLDFVRDWVADEYAAHGRPSIDPVVFFKLQLVLFFEGLRSERQLMRVVADRLSLRWYLGYDFGEALPDHSSLTRIRERYGLSIFQRFFERVVELCAEAGLIWGKELIFDATKVGANASMDSLVPRFYLQAKAQAHLEALFAEPDSAAEPEGSPTPVEEPVGKVHAGPGTPVIVPLAPCRDPDQSAALAEANQGTWRLLEEHRLDPDRPPAWGYQRQTNLRVSPTDPDAALMFDGRLSSLGYHDHYVVDGGNARIILNAFVTPADVMENQPMLDLLRRVRFRWKLRPEHVVADTTYGTVENIRALEESGIRAYVPLPDWEHRTPYFGAARFTYDAERDEYRCPQGQPLRRWTRKFGEEVTVYRAAAAICNACPVKAQCTASSHGRQVRRSFYAAYLDRVRAYHRTAAYQRAMAKRKVWIEPLFGEAKDWHGLRRFRLRGLEKVNIEGLRIAAGQNLKRYLVARGWGRRQAPCGSLVTHGSRPSPQ
jgi:transposase